MKELPVRFDVRTALFAAAPIAALRALDAPGIAVCDVSEDEERLPERMARLLPHVLVLADRPNDPKGLLRRMAETISACPPRIVACFPNAEALDASADLSELPEAVRQSMRVPCARLALASLPGRVERARSMLRGLGMSERLMGFGCAAEGAALLSTVPPPLPPFQYYLYPQLARSSGISSAAVEKRLRGAIESAWLHGSLAAQAALLGLSVSAERGKPTNSELLCALADKLRSE